MKKVKDFILKAITTIAVFTFFISAAGIDGPDRTTCEVLTVVSLAWLFLFCYANGYMTIYDDDVETGDDDFYV